MNLSLTEASSLAIIDRQTEEFKDNFSPAQYEVVRRVIYGTADLEYGSLLKFSENSLAKGASALISLTPIVVDVPEIQVNIVPLLQQTFGNSVYCCATTVRDDEITNREDKIVAGLSILAKSHPKAIFIIGREETAMSSLVELMRNKVIEPSVAIATPPIFIESDTKRQLKNSSVPSICLDSPKGGTDVASAIFTSLLRLAWKAQQN